jgi:hypothetical protein
LYKPYPVQSKLVKYEKGTNAWSSKQHDKSNEVAYGADAPADFVVEPYTDAELSPQALFQRQRKDIYKVKDSHSYINPYTHSDHAWSNDQHDVSDEVKWVDHTKTLHADYIENLDPSAEHHLIDGRTGVPSDTTTALM